MKTYRIARDIEIDGIIYLNWEDYIEDEGEAYFVKIGDKKFIGYARDEYFSTVMNNIIDYIEVHYPDLLISKGEEPKVIINDSYANANSKHPQGGKNDRMLIFPFKKLGYQRLSEDEMRDIAKNPFGYNIYDSSVIEKELGKDISNSY